MVDRCCEISLCEVSFRRFLVIILLFTNFRGYVIHVLYEHEWNSILQKWSSSTFPTNLLIKISVSSATCSAQLLSAALQCIKLSNTTSIHTNYICIWIACGLKTNEITSIKKSSGERTINQKAIKVIIINNFSFYLFVVVACILIYISQCQLSFRMSIETSVTWPHRK